MTQSKSRHSTPFRSVCLLDLIHTRPNLTKEGTGDDERSDDAAEMEDRLSDSSMDETGDYNIKSDGSSSILRFLLASNVEDVHWR